MNKPLATGPYLATSEVLRRLAISERELGNLARAGQLDRLRSASGKFERWASSQVVALLDAPREEWLLADPPPPPWQPPNSHVSYRRDVFLYVVELGSVVKVGITVRPRKRLQDHANLARAFGVEPGRCWVSVRHHARASETRLKDSETGEWLRRPFEDVRDDAAQLIEGREYPSISAVVRPKEPTP